ncbi:hypothetical protein BD779DRAFT_1476244 [Infundibulicybe gibba]|nr:hypothetical protein BD779DRAFT_1476244 [Infundibulicybe gibba]
MCIVVAPGGIRVPRALLLLILLLLVVDDDIGLSGGDAPLWQRVPHFHDSWIYASLRLPLWNNERKMRISFDPLQEMIRRYEYLARMRRVMSLLVRARGAARWATAGRITSGVDDEQKPRLLSVRREQGKQQVGQMAS